MQSFITQLWRDKLDVIFPRSCVHCGGVVEGGRLRHLCPACERLLFVVRAELYDVRTGQCDFGRTRSRFVRTAAGLPSLDFASSNNKEERKGLTSHFSLRAARLNSCQSRAICWHSQL
jgi:hypothetical protein